MEHAHPITLDIKVILTCLLLIRRGRGWDASEREKLSDKYFVTHRNKNYS